MMKYSWILLLLAATRCAVATNVDKRVKQTGVQRIVSALSADDMKGRESFSEGGELAAQFIEKEFSRIGLSHLPGLNSFRQPFTMINPTVKSVAITVNGEKLGSESAIIITTQSSLNINEASAIKKVVVKKGEPISAVGRYLSSTEDVIVFMDAEHAARIKRAAGQFEYMFSNHKTIIFVTYPGDVNTYSLQADVEAKQVTGYNIVGFLPGKTKREEQVIFGAHYDHMGIGAPKDGDSIYNGANDNASGVTGVIMAAEYYKKAKTNERSLVFVAFSAEEHGLHGSDYFSKQMQADKVVAMFNLEMIGTESKWGNNSAYITGFPATDFGTILQKNVDSTVFKFYPDPYPQMQLFYRSDNATLARAGVPAHTISTSKMDAEPNYHKVTDEMKHINVDNMTSVIRNIIRSSSSIVKGTDTPTRVNPANLRGRQ